MNSILEKIKNLADRSHSDVIAIRRHLHAHPELSFEEINTSKYISETLTKLGIKHQTGIVKTGITGVIEGRNPLKKIIALRADIDALPIIESNATSYKSTNPGVMHACGHDVHSASLLGCLKILHQLKDDFEGSVKFLFQPGEEVLPGGASLMIKDGALENPKPVSIFGQHVFPSMECGKVGFRKGMYMASTDELHITVKGKGGHAAMPLEYINPLIIAAHLISNLDEVFMQNKPEIPTVLAFGKIEGNGATNIIPEEVKLQGTFRTMNESWRTKAHEQMIAIANSISKKFGGKIEFNIIKGYPFLVNDEKLTEKAIIAARQYLGQENVQELDIRMTAEDFAWYSQHMPACFYRLGTGNKAKGITSGVHTSTFDIDEEALKTGMGLMAWLTINELKQS